AGGHHSSGVKEEEQSTYPGGGLGPGYAPAGSPDRGGLDGEREHYNTIIKVARSVTQHKSDGQYNQAKLDQLDHLEEKLTKTVQGAEAALGSNDLEAKQPELHKQVTNLKSMAQHYINLIGEVRAAKQGSYGFTDGQLPRWVAPKPPEEPKDETEPDMLE